MDNNNKMLSDINQFKTISIRARFAFAMLCFEKTIGKSIKSLNIMHKMLNKAWQFTESYEMDDWLEDVSDLRPDYILVKLDPRLKSTEDVFDSLHYLSIEEVQNLIKIYNQLPDFSLRILSLSFDIASEHIYSTVGHQSDETLVYINEILAIMENNQVSLPCYYELMNLSFSEEKGWGKSFSKNDVVNK